MKQPTIAITGANGFIGSHLVEHFSAKGWQVLALVQDAKQASDRPRVKYVTYELAKGPATSLLKNVDYLIHTAYVKQDHNTPNAYTINLEGTKKLLAASQANNIKQNIFLSTMSAQADAVSVYGKQKFAIEKLFSGKGNAVLRLGLVIGNGGLGKEIANLLRTKRFVPLMNGGKQPLQFVAISDVVQVIDRILSAQLYGTYTIAHPNRYNYKQFYVIVGKHIGTSPIFIPVPFILPLLIIRAIKLLRLPLNVTEDNVLGLKRLRYYDTTADLKKIGISLKTLQEALQQHTY